MISSCLRVSEASSRLMMVLPRDRTTQRATAHPVRDGLPLPPEQHSPRRRYGIQRARPRIGATVRNWLSGYGQLTTVFVARIQSSAPVFGDLKSDLRTVPVCYR